MKKLKLGFLSLLLLPGVTLASPEISLGLSDHSLSFAVSQSGSEGQWAFASAQITDDEHKLRQAEVGLGVAESLSDQVAAGVGLVAMAQTFETSSTDFDGIALAVRLSTELKIPGQLGLLAAASIDYAPGITSIQDLDSYQAFRASIAYPLLSRGTIGLGYHNIQSETDSAEDDVTVDEAITLQLSLKF